MQVLQQADSWFSDHFALRLELISVWDALNAKLLHTSGSDDVVVGKDGWLYYGATLPDYTGTSDFSQRELWRAARSLFLMQEYVQGQGADFLFTIAPNKNSLYPAYMPGRFTQTQTEGNALRLLDALKQTEVDACDLFSVFTAQDETLYYEQDSHWTNRGAALAADTILGSLGRSTTFEQGPFTLSDGHLGDLYGMLYPAGSRLEPETVYQPELEYALASTIRSAEDITIQTMSRAEGSLLCFRDSFGNALYPYLAASFGSGYFSRKTEYPLYLLAEQNADAVVIELVERNLDQLLRCAAVFPAPERDLPQQTVLGAETVDLRLEASQDLTGYLQCTGSLNIEPDADSPIYLILDDVCYEASPAGANGNESFTAFVPLGAWDTLRVAAIVNGAFMSFPAAIL